MLFLWHFLSLRLTGLLNRFTELVQQDHENEQAEVRAKVAMETGDEEAEKGFQGKFTRQNLVELEGTADEWWGNRFHAGDS